MDEEQGMRTEQPQTKQWYTPLTRKTLLSKYFVLTLFVALPFLGFWLWGVGNGKGMQLHVGSQEQYNPVTTTTDTQPKPHTDRLVPDADNMISQATSSTEYSTYRDKKYGIEFTYPNAVPWTGTLLGVELDIYEFDKVTDIGFCNSSSCFMFGPPFIEIKEVNTKDESMYFAPKPEWIPAPPGFKLSGPSPYCGDESGLAKIIATKKFTGMYEAGTEIDFEHGCKVYQFIKGNIGVFFVFGYGDFGDQEDFAASVASTTRFIY